jgi:hypothetical protein
LAPALPTILAVAVAVLDASGSGPFRVIAYCWVGFGMWSSVAVTVAVGMSGS